MEIRSPEDIKNHLYVGKEVRIGASPQIFTITDDRSMFTDGGPVPNPVTLVTVDQTGRPHIITVSAYCLSTV
jgi:hypothetical protein